MQEEENLGKMAAPNPNQQLSAAASVATPVFQLQPLWPRLSPTGRLSHESAPADDMDGYFHQS